MLIRYWWTLAVIAAARGAVAAEDGPARTKNDTAELGEVRCFCNQPECVATSYMCKSPSGVCYSDLHDFADLSRATHGCLELLQPSRRNQCENSPPPQPPPDAPDRPPEAESRTRDHSLLLCCDRDMCNHVDSSQIQKTQSETRRVLPPGAPGMLPPMTPAQYNNELWFKAATIAVPICGAVILVVLIALAVRILKKEAFSDGAIIGGAFPAGKPRPAHSGIVYPHAGLARLDKNAALAKLNTRHAAEYALLNKEPMDGHHPNSGMYRDVNLSLAAITPTSIDSESSKCKLYAKPGVQAWGNPSPV